MYVNNNKHSQGEQIIQNYNVALEPYSALPLARSPLNWKDGEDNFEEKALKSGNLTL
jgi:hypothetical protein